MNGDGATSYVPPQWWNNGNPNKDQVSWWRTKTITITNEDDYMDGSGNVKARMTIRKTGPLLGITWSADFEQLVWMWN